MNTNHKPTSQTLEDLKELLCQPAYQATQDNDLTERLINNLTVFDLAMRYVCRTTDGPNAKDKAELLSFWSELDHNIRIALELNLLAIRTLDGQQIDLFAGGRYTYHSLDSLLTSTQNKTHQEKTV